MKTLRRMKMRMMLLTTLPMITQVMTMMRAVCWYYHPPR
jgi:hypothetical protein